MRTRASVGIDDNLAASQSAVAVRPPDDETTRGVDVVSGVCVEQVGGDYFLYDLFDHVFFNLLVTGLGSMLGREDHGPYPHGLTVVVLDADLRLGVWAQIGNFLVLAQPR